VKYLTFTFSPDFSKYLDSLDSKSAASLLSRIEKIEEQGLRVASAKEWIKTLDSKEKIYEVRARSNEVFPRGVYFKISKEEYYLTHGFNKKKNKTPQKEIKRAINIKQVYVRKRKDD
jgi:phage-related protein